MNSFVTIINKIARLHDYMIQEPMTQTAFNIIYFFTLAYCSKEYYLVLINNQYCISINTYGLRFHIFYLKRVFIMETIYHIFIFNTCDITYSSDDFDLFYPYSKTACFVLSRVSSHPDWELHLFMQIIPLPTPLKLSC